MVRLAKLVIEAGQLQAYRAILKEEIEASLRLETGVQTLYAMAEKADPTRINILEIYADQAAYEAHIQSPHFLKYKSSTLAMVRSLELMEVEPLIAGMKP